MHTTTDLPTGEADRIAGILEDRHEGGTGVHPTVEARQLAEVLIAGFQRDTPSHWSLVASSLTDSPEMLDSFAAQHGLPRPTDAVKATTIALIRSQGLAAAMSPIPPASERPVCVTVGWLAEHPGFAAQLEYLDHNTPRPILPNQWRPASEAVDMIDPGWPVEVRQRMHVVGA